MSDGLFEDERTIEVFTASLGVGTCNYAPCSKTITWGQVVKSGRLMCFDGPLSAQTVVRTGTHEGKATSFLLFKDNHWKDCPGAPEFKRKEGRRA